MELLTAREVQSMLHVSRSTLCAIVASQKKGLPPFPVIRVGRCHLLRCQAVEQWLLEVEQRGLCNADRSKS
jgi:transposase